MSQCCQGQLSSFTMATISSPAISRALLPMTSKADKLPLETEPVARHNNTSWTLKPGHQMFVAPYSTDNRSSRIPALCVASWLAACLLAFLLSFCHSFNVLTYFFYMFWLFNLSSLIWYAGRRQSWSRALEKTELYTRGVYGSCHWKKARKFRQNRTKDWGNFEGLGMEWPLYQRISWEPKESYSGNKGTSGKPCYEGDQYSRLME